MPHASTTPCIFCDLEDEPMTDIAVMIETDGSKTILRACDDMCTGIWASTCDSDGFSYAIRYHYDAPSDAAFSPLWTGDTDE
jgi:hypothetical protein